MLENEKINEEDTQDNDIKPDDNLLEKEAVEQEEINEVEDLKSKVDELSDKNIRLMAEFENYRKRNEKEKNQMYEIGATSIILKLLDVVDNFERGINAYGEENQQIEGFVKIYNQLLDELKSLDVVPIEAVGKSFDINYHNAVLHVDDDTVSEAIVVEELQKGYTYKGKVIRYSMVKVAN